MDPEKIREAVNLLVSNALRHTQAGSITLSVSRKEGNAVFTVSDTGAGIPEDNLPTIFDRFETVGKPGESGGAGLGLSICREIVILHGGTISVESKIGEGSSFRFEIPARNSSGAKEKRNV
jgi:signal transduction histidine kinase